MTNALRPSVTLKLATSLDGKIATSTGHSQWITGPQSRAEVHRLRAAHDGIITGIGTILADDPMLTARLKPMPERQPVRIVLDRAGRLPANSKLLTTQELAPLLVFQGDGSVAERPNITEYVPIGIGGIGVDLAAVLGHLSARGLKTVMVEAGARLAGAFLRAGLVDRIEWFRAPIIIGGDGLSVLEGIGVDNLGKAPRLTLQSSQSCGEDAWETYLVA